MKQPTPHQPQNPTMIHNAPGTSGEQTTLINNEEEAFALPPLDATLFPGAEKRRGRGN